MRWSFNVNGLAISNPEWQALIAWGQEVRPTWITIMDDKDKAKQWASVVGGRVNYRTYDKRDNYYHHAVSGEQAAVDLERDHADMLEFDNIWHYYRGNELGGEWKRIQDWLIEFATAAKKRGFKITSCGLAIAKNWLSPEWVEAGNVDDLIWYADGNRDTFRVAVHNYVTGTVLSSQMPNYPAVLFERERLIEEEQHVQVKIDTYGANWDMWRETWVTNVRSRHLGIRVLPYIVDEGIYDFNAHIIQPPHDIVTLTNGQRVHTETELRSRFGDPRFNRDVRGILGHRMFFGYLLTGKIQHNISDEELAEFAVNDMAKAEKVYPENCETVSLFAANKNWRDPEGHDYLPLWPHILPKMARILPRAVSPDPDPIPQPEPTPDPPARIPVRIAGRAPDGKPTAVNIRNTANGTPKALLPAYPTETTAYLYAGEHETTGGYTWQKYDVELKIGTITGYMATDFVYTFPDTVSIALTDWQALQALVAELVAIVDKYVA